MRLSSLILVITALLLPFLAAAQTSGSGGGGSSGGQSSSTTSASSGGQSSATSASSSGATGSGQPFGQCVSSSCSGFRSQLQQGGWTYGAGAWTGSASGGLYQVPGGGAMQKGPGSQTDVTLPGSAYTSSVTRDTGGAGFTETTIPSSIAGTSITGSTRTADTSMPAAMASEYISATNPGTRSGAGGSGLSRTAPSGYAAPNNPGTQGWNPNMVAGCTQFQDYDEAGYAGGSVQRVSCTGPIGASGGAAR